MIFLFAMILFSEPLVLTRRAFNQPYEPPSSHLTLKMIFDHGTESHAVHRYQHISIFKDFPLPAPSRRRTVWRVLVLRVEFVEDDDPSTSGNGKMDFLGYGSAADGLYYDPPHVKKYFTRQMQFLSNFYKSNSFGNLEIEYTVKPDHPTKSYQLPHMMGYYSGFVRYDTESGFVYYNVYAMEMGLVRILADAIASADFDPTVDFSEYDEIIIFHAGTLMQTSLNFFRFRDIPSATIPRGALETYLGIPYLLANAGTDTIWSASINSEMARVDEYMVGNMGTICHEFGHLLGLPDLYDVTGYSNGVGSWCLMGTGGWEGSPAIGAPEGVIPANLSAWPRYWLGWVDPVVVADPETLLTLRASEIDTTQYGLADQTMIQIPISETEFFLLENRQQDIQQKDTVIVDVEDGVPVSVDHGEYDFFIPGSGVLIWHVDDKVIDSTWAYNIVQINPQHKGVDLEEADGIQHFDAWFYVDSIEYYGSRYDAFFVSDDNKANSHLGPFTNPNSDAYFGKSLYNIEVSSALDTIMNLSFDLGFHQAGFPIMVRRNQRIQATTYGDLDGNGDIEIVVATYNGHLYAYNHDGSLYASYSSFKMLSTYLSVGDVNGDQADDVLFGSGFEIICLDGTTLTPFTNFSFAADNDITGTPLLYDLNGDSSLEIIIGSKDRYLHCLDSLGNDIAPFPLYLNTELLSTPCVFDNDKRFIGTLGSDGRFWIINEDGVLKEFTDAQHNMLTFAAPVVGDLDRDGDPEAVIINGYGTIYIYSADTLEEKFDILIDTTFYVTPALADLDQDGYLEIIMPNSSRSLYVTNRNGTSENNFPIHFDDYLYYPLVIADLDDDGTDEIIVGIGTSDSLGSGELRLLHDRNHACEFSPLFGEGGFNSPGAVLDLDGDGDLELASGTDFGRLYVWDFPGQKVSWSCLMNSPKQWGFYTGILSEPQSASGLIGSFYIYPSPVENEGVVRFFLNQEAEVKVEILDIVGHQIGHKTLEHTTANEYNEIGFNFERQSNGMYIVRIEASNGTVREVKFKKFAVLK